MAARLTALLTVACIMLATVGCGSGTDPKAEAASASKATPAVPGSVPKKPKSGDFE